MKAASTHAVLLAALALTGCGESGDGFPVFPQIEALDTTPDPACSGTWVAGVLGRVVDESSRPIDAGFAQMCVRLEDETLACLAPEQSGVDGYFAKIVPEDSRCMSELNLRSLLPGAPFGTTYCRAPLGDTQDGILRLDPVTLYAIEPPVSLPPEGDPEAARTVVFAGGLEIDVRPGPLFGMYPELAGGPVDARTCFTDVDLDGLYALSPESLTYRFDSGEPGFPIRIPTDLAEGTTVDLYVLGGLDEIDLATGTRLKEGALEVFGTGTVVDGMVVNDPGSELPYINWLGYRAQR